MNKNNLIIISVLVAIFFISISLLFVKNHLNITTIGAQVSSNPDLSAASLKIVPISYGNTQSANVSFYINNGGASSGTQWQLVVLDNYDTINNKTVEVMKFIGNSGTIQQGQSKIVSQIIDLQSSQLKSSSTYYLMLIIDTDPQGNDANYNNNIYVSRDYNNQYGTQTFGSQFVIPISNFNILSSSQSSQSQQPSTLTIVNVDDATINYYENPSNPLIGDYDINFKVNTSETAYVCGVLEVLDNNGNVNYKDDGCANNVVFTLDPSQLNDIDFPADADTNSDDKLHISLFDSQTNDLLHESFFDISQYIQVSGYLDVLDHYIEFDLNTYEWIYTFIIDNSYPSGYSADLRFRIVTTYFSGSTNTFEINEEISKYYNLKKGKNNLEYRVPSFLDEINYTAYVEGLGVVVAHDQWEDDYPSVNLPNVSQTPTGQVSYDINFFLDSGLFNVVTVNQTINNVTTLVNTTMPDKTAINYLSVPAFDSMWNFTTATESCLLANVNEYVAYSVSSITEDPNTGDLNVDLKKAPSSYSFSEGYAVIAVPENKSCPIQGTLIEDFVTQNLPQMNPKQGWRAELPRPEWNGLSLDNIQGLCPQGSSFVEARVVDQGQMLTHNGGFTFDFSAIPETFFKALFIKCG